MKPLEDNDDNVIVVVLFSKENPITTRLKQVQTLTAISC